VQSFDEAFVTVHHAAYRVAYKLLGDRAEAEDIAQESLARALVRWHTIEPYAVPWVSRVAANLAIDKARKDRRARGTTTERGWLDPDAAERIDLVRALRSLPRRQRDVVLLRYLLDQSEEHVAGALGVSVGSVKTHASRGLAALRLALGEPVEA
jgi:RNA polymerase sigma factor (sigma-70 family)